MAMLAACEDDEKEGRLYVFPSIHEAPNCRKSVGNALDALKMRWAEDNKKGAITMTENEAIKYIQSDIRFIDMMIEHDKGFDPKADINRYLNPKTAYEMAISALEEIQQYREIGTVEDVKEAMNFYKFLKESTVSRIVEKCVEYEKIGTVEEFLEAAKKQRSMKVTDIHVDEYFCPVCGAENCCDQGIVRDRYCPNCGQRIGIGG